ncbi:MAG: hypothetical protein H0U89_11945, partial [Acidimicrobiia bacterium]|nr:hypothetical protein [Acidimicrobiia bacterium]
MTVPLAADLTNGGGSALASWTPLWVQLGLLGAAVTGLVVTGRSDDPNPLLRGLRRIPNALERLTGVSGWAAATIGTSLFGLLVAGQGFYSDVSWHIALGRDDEVLTAPHTAIVVGLVLIAWAGGAGVLFATLDRVDTRLRWGGLRIPWSAGLLGLLGLSAVAGFPLDELWHQTYGVDVTMWSPTHMLMILGAAFSGAASWLVLAEAGVPVSGRRWWRGLHVVAAWLTLQGLTAPLGEFAFGVPQFNQLFHPLIICMAAGLAVVAMRLVLGRGWAFGIVFVSFLLDQSNLLAGGNDGPVRTRAAAIYLVSAAVVEVVALLLGTERRPRFALVSGLGIGTIGLAGEWAWNANAYQPWRAALLPEALVLGLVVAVAAAILGVAYGNALGGRPGPRSPGPVLLGAAAVLVAALAWPMPRSVGEVTAAMRVEPSGRGAVDVEVDVTPADAGDGARWFQASSWQGGELALAEMEEVAPGRWASSEPVPIGGSHKSLLRLHRGGEMMAVPVFLPDDPEIGEPEIPA